MINMIHEWYHRMITVFQLAWQIMNAVMYSQWGFCNENSINLYGMTNSSIFDVHQHLLNLDNSMCFHFCLLLSSVHTVFYTSRHISEDIPFPAQTGAHCMKNARTVFVHWGQGDFVPLVVVLSRGKSVIYRE